MGKFNKGFGDHSRGGFGGGDRGERGGSRDGGRDFGRPALFDATCGDCGKETKVPFRPTGERPVYCRECFVKHGGGQELGRQAGARNGFEKFRKPDNFVPRSQIQTQAPQSGGNNNTELKRELEQVNIKLERLISAVEKLVTSKQSEIKVPDVALKVATKKVPDKAKKAKKK